MTLPPLPSRQVGRDHDRVTVTVKGVTEPDRAADRYHGRRGRRKRAESTANAGTHAVAPDTIATPNVRVGRKGAPVRKDDTRHLESEADHAITLNVDRKRHTKNTPQKRFALRRVSH